MRLLRQAVEDAVGQCRRNGRDEICHPVGEVDHTNAAKSPRRAVPFVDRTRLRARREHLHDGAEPCWCGLGGSLDRGGEVHRSRVGVSDRVAGLMDRTDMGPRDPPFRESGDQRREAIAQVRSICQLTLDRALGHPRRGRELRDHRAPRNVGVPRLVALGPLTLLG
ncbi:hypothetical protein GCM10009777_04200 [Microbacterium pumilum]|uniref:Uncharacterized protein n=1 Tax=Microbacterium pumilum TaxID=344165 RepID=A0ABP5D5Z5_9MICO